MADETGISWCDVTFNPWLGCEKVSPGCAHCYAETLAEGRMGLTGERSVWGPDAPRKVTADSTWRKPVGWNRESLAQGRKRYGGRPDERIRVFCASMADAFEIRPDLEAPRRRLFELVEATPELDWLVLTKRPDAARAWLFDHFMRRGQPSGWTTRDGLGWGVLPNVWIGASVENARFTWRADSLREIPATVRFLSAEPLVGSLYPPAGTWSMQNGRSEHLDLAGIDWVIVGGESGGRDARPMRVEWAREVRDAVLSFGAEGIGRVPELPPRPALHFKQWGSHGPDGVYRGPSPKSAGKLLDGVDYCEFPCAPVLVPA